MQIELKDAVEKFNLSYAKEKIDIDNFKCQFENFYKEIKCEESKNSSEEQFKLITRDFLLASLYGNVEYKISIPKDEDQCILNNEVPNVLIEYKTPYINQDMINHNDLNRKALHEAILYYLIQRIEKNNIEIKHIIITNTKEWYIFDALEFNRAFYENKKYSKTIEKKEILDLNKRQQVYNYFKKIYAENQPELKYYYFNIEEIFKKINNLSAFKLIYKTLHPDFLLKEYKPQQEVNELKGKFYPELLHILGLKQEKKDRKPIIVRDKDNKNSLLDITYNKLKDQKEDVYNEEKLEDLSLELAIIWINRLLFIRLFESKLIEFNNNDETYKILTHENIPDFDSLNDLFFKILNKEDRDGEFSKFKKTPYLNSSLFEQSEQEKNGITISNLRNKEMRLYTSTILVTANKNNSVKLLWYLIEFLNSYNFGDVIDSEQPEEKNINSAVLGLIFEKINGYKDGSVYTPSIVTEYMAKRCIENIVLSKVNKKYNEKLKNIGELKKYLNEKFPIYKDDSIPERKKLSNLVNSLKICDPSVGSGHFLVSVLNQLIKIKYDLGILFLYGTDEPVNEYEIIIENDALKIKRYKYDRYNDKSTLIQKTIFKEKRILIENCLFGVDINPKSVEICRLRLWIELLKNTYYIDDYKMETLPNIDINIKCGNSLVHKMDFSIGESSFEIKKNIKGYKKANFEKIFNLNFKDYRDAIIEYKNVNNKKRKHELKGKIENSLIAIKTNLRQTQLGDKINPLVYKDIFEWAFEFPEIISIEEEKIYNENIKKNETYIKYIFKGFDVIIANPPYGVSIKSDLRKVIEGILGHVPDYEIYYYFMELGYKLLSEDGEFAYIVPNSYLFNVYANDYRKALLNKWGITEILDCSKFPIFKEVTVRNAINIWEKYTNDNVGYRKTADSNSFEELISKPYVNMSQESLLNMNQNWSLAFALDEEVIKTKNKIKGNNKFLNYYYPDISQGLIAYDKYQGQSEEIISTRAYHYTSYEKEGLKKWLRGEDITKYRVNWNGKEYIDYCDGIANPRQPKYFQGRRLLIREITNPSIYVALTSEELYNDPSVIVVLGDNSQYMETILAILNSKLATFYHFNNSPKATKGAFPKILVKDIKEFPIPNLHDCKTDEINLLVSKILKKTGQSDYLQDEEAKKQVLEYQAEIDKLVYNLYNLDEEEIKIIEEI